jgi:NADH-quinone oxidoreductase subunit E
VELEQVNEILDRYEVRRGLLVPILQDIQAVFNYLPRPALEVVAKRRHVPISQVYSVANFYAAFSLVPRGKNIVNVCMGTACHVRGSGQVLEEFERRLKIKAGETSSDMMWTLLTVNCLGACALGPVVVFNDNYRGHMTRARVVDVLDEYAKKASDGK